MQKQPKPSERQFPPIYEKLVPVAIVVLTLVIVAMFVFSVGVAVGWVNF